ncbi:MAG TPA: phytanoyl-CoA dioxygenase family protein [Bryobacteraceae bacterium]|nr:phytanoyl-CoA dioxygenase family protein [Bryobacteraceae bacterium]
MKAHADELRDVGFVVLPNFLRPETVDVLVDALETLWSREGDEAGSEFRKEPEARRLANLVDKGEVFKVVWNNAAILELVSMVLGPKFKLSSLNARSTNPYSRDAQPLHVDMGAIADEHGYWVCNTMWLLDDFTAENGATRAVPGTHKRNQRPQDALEDPQAPHPDEQLIIAPRGSVVVMNAHMWHGGTANRTGAPRRALHSFYCRWDKPQQQWQSRLLHPQTIAGLSAQERQLLAIDDAENDALCAAGAGQSGFLR